ncbi:MAG: adenylate/guanylate cyclase domain-containing protein [Candidatus Limnocylindrales bacterium]
MPDLPSGTVTFVFSDLEGSTRLLKQLGDEQFAQLLAQHRTLLREVFGRHGGNEIDTQGDAFFYSFARARSAVAAAVELQRAHVGQAWPGGVQVNVRLGLHTGEPVVGEEGYTGLDVVRAARIAADGEGGQILLSEATRAIVGGNLPEGVGIRELGERTLKDIDRPEPLFELVYAPDSPAAPESAKPVESAPAVQSAVQKAPAEVSFDVKPASMLKQWQQMARLAFDAAKNDEDPGRLIEERVLAQLKETFGDAVIETGGKVTVKPPKPAKPANSPSKSAAKQLETLNELRESGVLSDEQYSKAVDRLLAEG